MNASDRATACVHHLSNERCVGSERQQEVPSLVWNAVIAALTLSKINCCE
uniref:Uncharacterized protein n=1 Tax=Anopheles dirus TaxID=7168 RepID=A0A182NX20_9DIPT